MRGAGLRPAAALRAALAFDELTFPTKRLGEPQQAGGPPHKNRTVRFPMDVRQPI